MTSECGGAPVYRLVRWLLLALIAAGVIGMHVLSEQDTGTGHGMVMDATAVAQSASGTDHRPQSMEMMQSSTAYSGSPVAALYTDLTAPAHQDMSGAMAMCLLFLAAGAAAIALLLLAVRLRRHPADLTTWLSGPWGVNRRGPPPLPVPPHSLCILRV